MSDRFFAVTGGPSAGRTSLLTELACRHFHTIPKYGRAISREEMQSGGDPPPSRGSHDLCLCSTMLERGLRAYSAAQALYGPVIFDRGISAILAT